MVSKQELTEEAIPELHQFSMLQRFRQGRDFKMPDKPTPKAQQPKGIMKKGGASGVISPTNSENS